MIAKFHPVMKRIVLAAALAVGATGIAHADDSSMNPFIGDSYAAFNGGYNRPAISNPSFDKAPSAWRQANPNGLSERVLQSYSAPGEAWRINQPVLTAAAGDPGFGQTHPNGLTEREYQALSSEAPAWQFSGEPGGALASENQAPVAQAPLGARLAALFHRNSASAAQ
ncbi:MAG TPA: hypothetical protein VF814_17200 [Casimicrobiaceae bacterium]